VGGAVLRNTHWASSSNTAFLENAVEKLSDDFVYISNDSRECYDILYRIKNLARTM